ncbi:hypothetical protein F2P56_023662 [Juglans regia]|uniref:Uncharacterized protein n=1 Tax=Juglans regia TaxID=51240 RepID=A0A833UEN4_JUGRE|nr:hypothetical protein F2P56_023662 [Juglans regia]
MEIFSSSSSSNSSSSNIHTNSSSASMPSFSHIVSTKLTTANFPIWQVQISAYLRGQDLFQYVDGSLMPLPEFLSNTNLPNPDYPPWRRNDQLVLSILFSLISDSVLGHVLSSNTSRALWSSLSSLLATHSQAKQFQVRFQLANLTRGDQNITDYFGKVRALANILAASGKPLPDPEFVTYLLSGLGSAYDVFVTSITTRAEPISSNELYQFLLIHESRLAHGVRGSPAIEPSVNLTTTTGRGSRAPYRGGRSARNGRGRFNHPNRGGRSFSPATSQHPTCQVCQKSGHVALQCRHRFDHSYQYGAPTSFSANFTQPGFLPDTTWYPDSAATHHITHDLNNLNLHSEPYCGSEQIRVGDGSGLLIQNTGHLDGEDPPHRANP